MDLKLFPVVTSLFLSTASPWASANQYNDTVPLVISSADAGKSWTARLHAKTPPPNRKAETFSDFVSVSCDSVVCVAVGGYTNNSEGTFPMLAVSFDQGKTWEYRATDTKLLPTHATFGRESTAYFTKVQCTEVSCVAVGAYRNNQGGMFPMALVSFDHGNTWAYKLDDTTKQLNGAEGRQADTRLNSVTCHDQTCVAVGRYVNRTLDGEFGVIIVSVDGGKTWTYQAGDKFRPVDLNPEKIAIVFEDVSCSKDLCAAVGTYSNKYKRTVPMLAMSTDNGTSWEYRIDMYNLPKDAIGGSENSGHFRRISCDNTLCAAIGSYVSDTGDYPHMILVSEKDKEGKIQWEYRVGGSLPPPNAGSGFFPSNLLSVQCKANRCAAVGSYDNVDGANFGMFLMSEDFGKTWEYQLSDSTPPPNSQSGRLARTYFTAVSCDPSTCYVVGAYDNTARGIFPLVAKGTKTEDGGRSWIYPVHDTFKTPLAPTDVSSYTFLNDVYCKDRNCVAVGGYYKQVTP